MKDFQEIFETGLKFHGHKCPAMPMGLKAGLAAMEALGVERSKDKELYIKAESGKGHAAGCFLDGLMTATGCTYGKSNIEKLHYNKMAFTLIDTATNRAVRVSLKPDFFEMALNSPFVKKREAGMPPQDIEPEITNPLVDKIIGLQKSDFLDIGKVHTVDFKGGKPLFVTRRCDNCGEVTFVNKMRLSPEGKTVCIPCSNYKD